MSKAFKRTLLAAVCFAAHEAAEAQTPWTANCAEDFCRSR